MIDFIFIIGLLAIAILTGPIALIRVWLLGKKWRVKQ